MSFSCLSHVAGLPHPPWSQERQKMGGHWQERGPSQGFTCCPCPASSLHIESVLKSSKRCKLLRLGFRLPDSKLSQCQVHPESPHVLQGVLFFFVKAAHLSWAHVRGGVQRATSQPTGRASIYSPWALQVCWTAKDLSNPNVNALWRKTLFHIPRLFFSISVLLSFFSYAFSCSLSVLFSLIFLNSDCSRLRYLRLFCDFQALHPCMRVRASF